jgi:hypothetical protein
MYPRRRLLSPPPLGAKLGPQVFPPHLQCGTIPANSLSGGPSAALGPPYIRSFGFASRVRRSRAPSSPAHLPEGEGSISPLPPGEGGAERRVRAGAPEAPIEGKHRPSEQVQRGSPAQHRAAEYAPSPDKPPMSGRYARPTGLYFALLSPLPSRRNTCGPSLALGGGGESKHLCFIRCFSFHF